MKTISIAALLAATTLTIPALTQARTVTLSTTLKNYGGDGAYLAVYLTDARGAYAGTLALAGRKAKYYKHLSDWKRLSAGKASPIDGVTGASVGEGRTLTVTIELADALFDAGYEIHVDAAVEDMRDSPSDIRVPLTTAGGGQAATGRQFVQSFSY
ncbi:MAG: DUF2271 domain-containing protein [Castellaniella sp.]|uniref:DUF2271 domain-containing protein n=1 Tax=Castellaniella sp. TaxID=1955812 RepID=UPI003C73D026